MKLFFKVLAILSAILYPIIMYFTLSHFNASPRVLALVLVSVAFIYFIANTEKAKAGGFKRIQFWGMVLAATALGAITFFTENSGYVKFYPVSINILLLFSFGITLFRSPNMIFRFAQIQDKSIEDSENKDKIESYCKKVTITWVIFFIFNGSMAVFTALFTSHLIWVTYNGLISYVLIGLIFVIELLIRKLMVKQ